MKIEISQASKWNEKPNKYLGETEKIHVSTSERNGYKTYAWVAEVESLDEAAEKIGYNSFIVGPATQVEDAEYSITIYDNYVE